MDKLNQNSDGLNEILGQRSAAYLSSVNSQIRAEDNNDFSKALPVLDPKALHGLAGDFVRTVYPHTESDAPALLLQLLAGFGNVVGRTVYYVADGARHYTNLYALIVGKTSAAKGSSLAHVMNLLEKLDATWAEKRVQGGLSSGEGLIKAVDDAENPSDRRLLVIESEFASVLHMNRREGNTLSTVIRNLWDKGSGATMTKTNAVSTTNAHVSIIGHITPDELGRYLSPTEIANGYANRFIFACVQRSKDLPDGGNLSAEEAARLTERFIEVIEFAQGVDDMKRDEEASELWRRVYSKLVADRPGGFGKATARARAQVLRLSLIYALLDCSAIVRRVHLEAALALWQFCEDSAAYLFSNNVLSDKAQKLLNAIRGARAEGLNKTEMYELFGRKVKKPELDSLLSEIESTGAASPERIATAGRDEERWIAAFGEGAKSELGEVDEERQGDEDLDSANSLNSPHVETRPETVIASPYTSGRKSVEELFGSEELEEKAA
jgi:hypothetical protein